MSNASARNYNRQRTQALYNLRFPMAGAGRFQNYYANCYLLSRQEVTPINNK